MKRLALAVAVLALGGGAAFGLWAVLKPPTSGLPEIGAAPDFSFVDQEGRTITKADLLGRPWIADLFFTRCTSICPVLTSRFMRLDESLPPGVVLVSFSIDPEHDTPAVLKAYATQVGANPKRWRFASTVDKARRDAFARGIFIDVHDTPENPANAIGHGPYLVLVDAQGKLRGVADGNDAEAVETLRKAATTLSLTGVYGLPAVNAALNGASLLLLMTGLIFAHVRRFEFHVAFVLGAVLCSAAFLGCYLTYHALAGSTRYPGSGTPRTLYLAMLLTHTVLAVVVPPLIITVIVKAARRRWDTHRRWARTTVPIWTYVSATGVLIYWVLFRGGA